MRQTILMEKYPVYHAEIDKTETSLATIDDVVAYLKAKIDETPKVAFIGVFDHYAHTRDIGGAIADGIVDARNVLFCFGLALPDPHVLSVRPRSIGIADMGSKFVVSFLEAPMKPANEAMEGWVRGMRDC